MHWNVMQYGFIFNSSFLLRSPRKFLNLFFVFYYFKLSQFHCNSERSENILVLREKKKNCETCLGASLCGSYLLYSMGKIDINLFILYFFSYWKFYLIPRLKIVVKLIKDMQNICFLSFLFCLSLFFFLNKIHHFRFSTSNCLISHKI